MIDVDIENQLVSKVAEVLMFIKQNKKCNIRKISKELDIDYNYVSKIILRCEEKNMLITEMLNREKQTILTEKGEKISKNLKDIKKELYGSEN